MRQFMWQQHCQSLFIHIGQLKNGDSQEETLVQVQKHHDCVVVHKGHVYFSIEKLFL